MVNRSEVSLGVAGFTITQVREEGIDFTIPFYEEPSAILIPPPKAQSKMFAVIRPFSWKVWIAVSVLLLVIAPVFSFLEHFEEDLIPKLYPHRPNAKVRYFSIQWYIFGGLLSQGGQVIPTNMASRVLLGVWWLVAITIIASYTGTLIAFLTVPTVTDRINSLEDLVAQRELKWTYRRYTSHDSLFSTSQSEIYKSIGSKHTDLRVGSDAEGIAGVLSGRWAFIKEKSYLDFALDHDFQTSRRCRLKIAKQEFFTAGFGWILETGSPVKDLFNLEFLRMSESGLFDKWRSDYWPPASNCSTGAIFTDVTTKPLMVEDIVSSLILYLLGVLLALLVFVLERLSRLGRPLAGGDGVRKAWLRHHPKRVQPWLGRH
ncbi:glutamate receptor ionotropic, delta-1-like [Pollicipes pollicipes]|uniref:glutamate receptor ionotropic, delta-1-like n=1 Tax=Pollicipes pollicipes TaxID=41117 RepID=UPI001884D60C|nr:glutamate receptor ionotropic, delta-1-like [Pollicipes pollicipes]